MSNFVLDLFKRKRKRNLSPLEKAELAQGKVTEAFIMFQQSHDAVMEANAELESAVVETEKEIHSLQSKVDNKIFFKCKMLDEIEANKKLAKKLEDFIK